MTATIEAVRNAALPTLMDILNDRQARKIDLVVPGSKLRFEQGELVLGGLDAIPMADGVTNPNGLYMPTATFDSHLAERLDVHPNYLRRLRYGRTGTKATAATDGSRLDLFDANVNGLLHGRKARMRRLTKAEEFELEIDHTYGDKGLQLGEDYTYNPGDGFWYKEAISGVPADSRSFLVRLFRSDESGRGIARALLSNRYLRMDDIDGLMAMLQGIQEAGIDPSTLEIYGDLTETRMYVHVRAPQIAVWAPELLGGYRSPFDTGIEGTKRQANGRSVEERAALGRQLVEERGWRAGREGEALNYGGAHAFYQPGTEPIIHAGFKLMDSELGNGRWQAFPEFTVLACDNGLTQTKEMFARTHLGSKLDDGHIEWSAETQGKELAWVASQTKDLVKLALSQEYLEERVAEMTEQGRKEISEVKAIQVLDSQLKFSKEDQAGIARYFLMGGQHTAGGLMQAVTAYSQTLDADAQFELDNKAMAALEFAAR